MPGAVGYSKRSRLDKLGVKSGMRVALVGLADAEFLRQLRGRTDDIADGRPRKNTDLVLFAVSGRAELRRLSTLRRAITPAGAIWVVWPKGQAYIKEDMIRAAAIAQGLVDIKVIAFSETLRGLKLVIPLARRPAPGPREERKTDKKANPKPPVVLPIELKRALARSPRAKAEFDKFPPSHRREVIGYIIETRKPETRERRAAQTVDLLEKGWPKR